MTEMSRLRQPALHAALVLAGSALLACSPDVNAPPTDTLDSKLRSALASQGVVALTAPPAQDPNLVALGRLLMFDKILSGN